MKLLCCGFILALVALATCDNNSYLNWGNGITNDNYVQSGTNIKRCNVADLQLSCTFTTTGFVPDKVALFDGLGYFTDFGGSAGSYLYAVDYEHCIVKYNVSISSQVGSFVYSRNTPALDPASGLMVLNSWNGGFVWAFNMSNGVLVWSTQVNNHPAAEMTMSSTIWNGRVFTGVSSGEESSAGCGVLRQCSFKGTFHSLWLNNGSIIWNFQTCPGVIGVVDGYAGNAVWGSSPSIDEDLGLVFIATGNNYIVPASVTNCTASGGFNCSVFNNYVDSVLALNVWNGGLVWASKFADQFGYDVWTLACVIPQLQFACPPFAGNDSDFGQMPMLGVVRNKGKPIKALFIGQKNGMGVALRRDNGSALWAMHSGTGNGGTPVGNAGGGIVFSQATDKKRTYFGNANYLNNNVSLIDGSFTTSGFWSGVDKDTGIIKWQTPEPNNNKVYGSMTVSNGLLYSGSMAAAPLNNLFIMDSATGVILRQFAQPGSQYASPTLDGDYMILGTGYTPLANPTFVPSIEVTVYKLMNNQNCDDNSDEN